MLSFFRSRHSNGTQSAAATIDTPAFLEDCPVSAPVVSDRERELEHALITLCTYLAESQGDLTRTLDFGSSDPVLLGLQGQLNGVFSQVRNMRLQLEELTVQTSTAAASSGHKMRQTASQMDEARQELDMAATGVGQSQAGVSEVARAASSAAALAAEAEEATTAGVDVIQGAIDSVSGIQQGIALAETRVGALIGHSEQIRKVSGVIEEIAQRTNLLALNAAIEAARAGEHGRGFAVVADEVRKLAEGTAAQTKEIRTLISAVAGDLAETGRAIQDGKGRADEGVALASKAGQALNRIEDLVKRSAEPLSEIAALAEEQSAALEQVTSSLQEVTQRVTAVTESTTAVAEVTSGLTGMTEVAFSALGQFRCGSMVDGVADAARRVERDVRQYLEAAVDAGRFGLNDLLSFQYHEYKGHYVDRLKNLWGDVSRTPRDGFSPPKFGTAYDHLVDVDLMKMLDHHLESSQHVGFMVMSDLNGYSPAQNSRYCKPWTGVFENDIHSRVKRMNCDHAQVRASRMGLNWVEKESLGTGVADVRNMRTVHSRHEFTAAGNDLKEPAGGDPRILVQTFTRHTGTIVNVLSVPLYVKGQRYGAIIVGWLPEVSGKKKDRR